MSKDSQFEQALGNFLTKTRRSGLVWLCMGGALTILAVIVPNSTYPLITLIALIGVTASGYVAPSKKAVFFLAAGALIAALVVWSDNLDSDGAQWLAAALVLILSTGAIVFHVRRLEARAVEYGWQAEIGLETAELGAFKWNADTDEIEATERLRKLYSLPIEGKLAGAEFFSRIHADDVGSVRENITRAIARNGSYRAQFRVVSDTGEERLVLGRGRVLKDDRSGRLSLAGINFDITEAKNAERNLFDLINGVDAILAILDTQGVVLELNREASESLKLEAVGGGSHIWESGLWREADGGSTQVRRLVEQAIGSDGAAGEVPTLLSDGEDGWSIISIRPLRDFAGRTHRLIFFAFDISKRKQAEEVNDLLVLELNHRIKNLLSVTNALINLSARYATSVEDFAEATNRRLIALHEAHNIGARDLKNRRTEIRHVIETVLRPWRTTPPRIFVEGENSEIDAGAATAWALIVHELAVKSASSGALAQSDGSLHISWKRDQDRFHFEWRERSGMIDGEAFQAIDFGGSIVNRLVQAFLGGQITKSSESGEYRINISIEE